MKMDKEIFEFCKRHSIRIIDNNKRAHKITKLNSSYFQSPYDYNKVHQEIFHDTEPLLTIEIAQSELEKLSCFESEVFNHMEREGHYNMFLTIMEQKEKEKFLKEKYPAVKKAYEHYSLMLKMAGAGEL